jgi:hypothetical protein
MVSCAAALVAQRVASFSSGVRRLLALALADGILVSHGRDRRWLDSVRQARGGCVCVRLTGFPAQH